MTEKPDLPSLTGLRCVAALSIVVAHGLSIVLFKQPNTIHFGLSYFGMSLFFVLSGFVIHLNYAPSFQSLPIQESLRRFAVARFARLYPLYAFFMLVSLSTIPWSRIRPMLPDLYWFIPMLQSWFLGNEQLPLMFTFPEAVLTWSISTELFFYMLFPLLLLFRLPRIPLFFELPLLLATGLAVLAAAYFVMPSLPTSHDRQWLIYYSPYCRLFEFIAGMLTARLYLGVREKPVSAFEARISGAIAVICGGFVAASITSAGDWMTADTMSFYDFIRPNLWNMPASAFLIFYAVRYDSGLRRMLTSRLALAGGEASYSIYLWHLFLLAHFHQEVRAASATSISELLVRLSIYVLLTVVISYGTYRVIEAPARRWIRDKFERRQRTAAFTSQYAGE
jgi:peptidoglycan/LPS O-acetylase OafA/YrhL